MNITEKIKSNIDIMTKSEYTVAAYFLENSDDFAFETLDAIASKINVSTTSVLRFCRKNGFAGYKALQDEVRGGFKYQLTLPDKFRLAAKSDKGDSVLSRTVHSAVDALDKTFASIPEERIYDGADAIIKAKRVFCFGMRESCALAHYAYTRFLTVRDNVFMLSASHDGEIESLLSIGKGDVCIFYLFHRYTRQSPLILSQIKKQGASTVLITNPPYEEIAPDADILLPCCVDIGGIKNSSVAPVCLTDCLCNAVVAKSGAETLEYMKKSESLFKNFTF